jgi:hypothetical protein
LRIVRDKVREVVEDGPSLVARYSLGGAGRPFEEGFLLRQGATEDKGRWRGAKNYTVIFVVSYSGNAGSSGKTM